MSYTEINYFTPTGEAKGLADVGNAWRGAMAIWVKMEEKYLPPYIPEWVYSAYGKPEEGKRYYRCHDADRELMKEIWALWNDEKVSREDKIVFGSTLDWVMVSRENIPEMLQAFRNFDEGTSLPEQVDIIEKNLPEDAIGISWNQTSVCDNQWLSFEPESNDEDAEYRAYNLLTDTKHWDLFKELGNE